MGSTEQSINEEEVFDRTCGRNVQKKPIYRRGPGDSGITLVVVVGSDVLRPLVGVAFAVERSLTGVF